MSRKTSHIPTTHFLCGVRWWFRFLGQHRRTFHWACWPRLNPKSERSGFWSRLPEFRSSDERPCSMFERLMDFRSNFKRCKKRGSSAEQQILAGCDVHLG